MMHHDISPEGAATDRLARKALMQWADAAAMAGVDMEGFAPNASSDDLRTWALSKGLHIGTIYARFSTKMQQSTEDQVREVIIWAARNGAFVPPALICVDEAASGSRERRDGLNRIRQILALGLATVLLVYKVSRLGRQAARGFQFIQQEVVEANLRAVSVSQGVDTANKDTWKLQLQIHGLMDDALLDTTADHVRSGQIGHFLNGHTIGALGVGYRPREVPGGRPTNRGLPRTEPEIDPEAADLIREHFKLHLEGMSIREGLRRWNAAGGPCDPRATTGKMSPTAYRRLLSSERLTGRWEYGRKRNQFSTKRDYVTQVEQPDNEVVVRCSEDLRILDDATFFELQRLLNEQKTGPRGPRETKTAKLWDLTTKMFLCSHCSQPGRPVRFYVAGANGNGMRCCNGECPHPSCVRRDQAVLAVCEALNRLIARDADLVAEVVSRSEELDTVAREDVQAEIAAAEKKLCSLSNRVNALYELLGEGSADECRETKAHLRAARSERSAVQAEVNRLRTSLDQSTSTLSPAEARETLSAMSALLTEAAAGKDGDDAVHKALHIFGLLTGECIWVTVEPRPGRKQTNVRGEFRPCLVRATTEFSGVASRESHPGEKIAVWLREPPRVDAIAERVHELIDVESLSYREAAKQLQREGHSVNTNNVWVSHRRWFEMQGLPVPKVPYNNGKTRGPD